MIKIFIFFLWLPFCLSLTCDVSGQCTQSYLVGQLFTNDQKSCIEECRDNSRSNWYTFRQSNRFCTLFANCTKIDDKICNDCVSGEAECPTAKCGLTGICEVIHSRF
jgi:hypothetical protein